MGNKIVRGHGSQSPAAFQSTRGIFDAHMTFEEPTEFEGSEVDIPDPVVNFLEADICSDANV
jgi:hypothetical protein